MRFLAAFIIVALATVAHADSLSPLESQKIQYLISSIETLDGGQFIRNGTAYDARSAADHLRLKLKNAGSRVRTAEDFITYCGSVSSTSKEPYQIRFSDGRVVTSEVYLRQKLAEFSGPVQPSDNALEQTPKAQSPSSAAP